MIRDLSTGTVGRQSGFRLRREGVDVVVTCAHFTEWPDNQKDFDEVAQRYSDMENGETVAIQTGEIEPCGMYGVKKHILGANQGPVESFNDELKLQLIAVHRPWNLAIFRVIEKPEHDDENMVIDWGQICFTAQKDRGKLGLKDFWWSVGYNLNNDQERFQSEWREFFLRQPTNIQTDIRQQHVSKPSHNTARG